VLQARQVSVGCGSGFPLGQEFALIGINDHGDKALQRGLCKKFAQLGNHEFFARMKWSLPLSTGQVMLGKFLKRVGLFVVFDTDGEVWN
jgi:hypothetical protein